MGERLVVKVERDDILLATLYYHWSAYTTSSMSILKSLYNHVLVNANQMSDDEIRLALIRFAEHSTAIGYVDDLSTLDRIRDERLANLYQGEISGAVNMILGQTHFHGGISGDDLHFVQTIFPNERFISQNVSRNEGLVSLSDDSMQRSIRWAEALMTIDLSEETVENETFYAYSCEEYIEHLAYLEEEDLHDSVVEIKDIPDVPMDVSSFNFSDIIPVCEIIQNNVKVGYVKYGHTIFEYV